MALRILCSAEGRWGRNEEYLEVFLDLHTTSLAWSQALGLGLGEQQPAPGTTRSTSSTPISGGASDAGITKPLLTWRIGRQVDSMNYHNKLLGEIWSALGFMTATARPPSRPPRPERCGNGAAGRPWLCLAIPGAFWKKSGQATM